MLIAPLPLVDCKYKQFKEAIERHVRPKERLLLSERTKFWQLRQQPGEPVDNYLQRIRLAAKQCQFEKLTEKTAAEELCRVQLISGLEDKWMTTRVLNYLETKETSTADELVDFIRRQLDVSEFTQGQGQVKSGQILLTKGKMSNSFRAKSSNPVSFSKTRSKPSFSVDKTVPKQTFLIVQNVALSMLTDIALHTVKFVKSVGVKTISARYVRNL